MIQHLTETPLSLQIKALSSQQQQAFNIYRQQLPELSEAALNQLAISLQHKEFNAKLWIDWLLTIKFHRTFSDIESLFLKYHIWAELDLKTLQNLELLLFQHNYHDLIAWCRLAFDCTYVINNTKAVLNEALTSFLAIAQRLHDVGLANNLPELPKMYHVFTYGAEPLKCLAHVLQQINVKFLPNQLTLLAALPELTLAKSLLQQGFPMVCIELLEQKPAKLSASMEECINQHMDLAPLCTNVLRYTAQYQAGSFLDVYSQVKHLLAFRCDKEELDKDDVVLIAKNYWRTFFAENNVTSVSALLVWGGRVKNTLGVALFLGAFDRPPQYQAKSLRELIELCQLLIELEEDSKMDLVSELAKKQPMAKLVESLVDRRRRYYQELHQQKSLEDTIRDFKTSNPPFVRFPLSEKVVDELKQEYLAVEELGKKYSQLAEPQLQQKINELKNGFFKIQPQERRRWVLEALAVIRERILLHFKLFPYNTQILSVLALTRDVNDLKGCIGQIGTGEGKSLIVCMLATLQGLQGYCVDVITSSRELAMRDQKKFAPFFASFGLTSSHICYDHPKKAHFRGQIIYATNYDFEFSIMRDQLFNMELRYSEVNAKVQERQTHVAIVDEADNLFIDSANNSARMSVSSPLDYSWIYALMANQVKNHPSNWQPNSLEIQTIYDDCERFRQTHYSIKPKFSLEQVKTWIHSARKAFFELVLNKDYVIEWVIDPEESERGVQPKISIVDYQNTGRINTGSRWQNGLHEFVEIKHGIAPKKEGLTAASMSHPSFFSYYERIVGLTGTIGEEIERHEIQHVYRVSTFDVPRHRPSQRKQLPARLYLDQASQHQALLKMAASHSGQGQPVLILVRTIQESLELSRFFKDGKMLHQVLNEKQAEDEEYIVGRAGISGMITIATNTAGRGTDIILSSDSKKAGGLHVIFAFYPANLRVEDQGLGRAGRQGQQGSCCLLLHLNDDEIMRLIPERQQRQLLFKHQQFMTVLNEKRTQKICHESQSRRLRSAIDTAQHEILKKFFLVKKQLFLVMSKLPLNQLAILFIQEFKQKPPCKPVLIKSDNLSYQQIVQQKLLIYIGQNSWENSKWEELLSQAVKAYQEKLSEEWAVFFTALDKGEPLSKPSQLEKIPIYDQLLLEKFLSFVEVTLTEVLRNTTQYFSNYILELVGHSGRLVIPNELLVDSANQYQDLLAEFTQHHQSLLEQPKSELLGSTLQYTQSQLLNQFGMLPAPKDAEVAKEIEQIEQESLAELSLIEQANRTGKQNSN